MVAVLAFATLVVSVVAAMLGQGGGTLYTPLQVWTGIGFHQAAATSLFLIMVTSVSASLVFRKAQRIDWPLALTLETVTTAGAFAGGLGSALLSGAVLSLIIAGVIVVAAAFMIWPMTQRRACVLGHGGVVAWARRVGRQHYCVNMAVALPLALAAGAVSGLVGIGGGVINVPMMVLVLGVRMEIAVGCSAVMVGLTAAGGFAGHLLHGHWDWQLSLILAAAAFIGGQAGSRITIRLDQQKLKAAFGWFLLLIAGSMVVKAVL